MIDSKIIESFETITLEEMGKVKLMNRVDTKYVTSVDKIQEVLRLATPEFYLQEISGRSVMPYYTRYYDTPDADMFYQHQRGKKNRQKIRIRHYEETSADPFVEIKTKNNKGRTRKKRVAMTEENDGRESAKSMSDVYLGTETYPEDLLSYQDFLDKNSNYDTIDLIPHIENHFYRLTLVNKAHTERITIDINIEFHNLSNGECISLSDIGIIEWKRDGNSEKSSLGRILRDLRIHPSGFSKYGIGMALTDPGLRQNRFKPRLRRLDKLLRSVNR